MPADPHQLLVDLPDETATAAFAEDVAARLRAGDAILLSGGLGAGKTTFARALIRAVADDAALEVPSPTFTLVQTYGGGRLPVAHLDLYRLSDAHELDEIGFDEALAEGAVLVEWPERAEARLPPDALRIAFDIAGAGRRATVMAPAAWAGRLARSAAIRDFLDGAGWTAAARRHLQGDASTRVYERVALPGRTAVVMDWQPAAASAAKDPRAAYRARDVGAFAAVDRALRSAGFSAPEIYAEDLAGGFLLLEDLGTEGILRGGAPIPERYHAAVDVLAAIHSRSRPAELHASGAAVRRLPVYGADALLAELDLFTDWYLPHVTGEPLAEPARAAFKAIWAEVLAHLAQAERSWVLLDYHSPNLLWLPRRKGLRRLGILDFQDVLIGPSAYDVASLAEDARATVPTALETDLKARYVHRRRATSPEFDAQGFDTAYTILAVQRATKTLGVFARLADHGGKREYLRHVPRLREYLARNLAHPVLSAYALWYETHVPSL